MFRAPGMPSITWAIAFWNNSDAQFIPKNTRLYRRSAVGRARPGAGTTRRTAGRTGRRRRDSGNTARPSRAGSVARLGDDAPAAPTTERSCPTTRRPGCYRGKLTSRGPSLLRRDVARTQATAHCGIQAGDATPAHLVGIAWRTVSMTADDGDMARDIPQPTVPANVPSRTGFVTSTAGPGRKGRRGNRRSRYIQMNA